MLAKPKRNKNEDHLSADETVVEKVKVLHSSSEMRPFKRKETTGMQQFVAFVNVVNFCLTLRWIKRLSNNLIWIFQ